MDVGDHEIVQLVDELAAAFAAIDWPVLEPELDMALLGWATRCCRLARAACLVWSADEESGPLTRSLLEHAAAIRWLAAAGREGVAAIEYHHRTWQRRWRDSVQEHGWELPEGAEYAPVEPPEKPGLADEFAATWRLLDALGLDWYPAFRIESATTHPSYLSAAHHWDTSGAAPELVYRPTEGPVPLAAIALLLGLALHELAERYQVAPMFTALAQAEDALGVRFSEPDH